MTEIYLIRHAQAEGNVYRMMQGHWDGNVTDMGQRQIDALAERMRDVKLDAVYTSDLYRARLTASALTRYRAVPVHCSLALREMNMGRWEAKFFGNVSYDEPALCHAFLFDQDRYFIEDGETYDQVGDRAYSFLEEILLAHPNQAVAIVSHGVTLRCLLSRITGLPLQDTEALPISRNTAISRVLWEDGVFQVDYLQDAEHLSPLGDFSWGKTGDLRDVRLDPAADRDYYIACYADAWQSVHGSLEGFEPLVYFAAAKRHLAQAPDAVLRLYHEDRPVGLLDMDPRRGAGAGYGWISLLYLCPEYRNQGYGIQALARAIFLFRALGRRALRLHVAEDNAMALSFYRKAGFHLLSSENGRFGSLLLLEKSLEGPGHA